MAKWHPESESPKPEDWFVRELRKIDPDLHVTWGMERYLRAEWAVERKTPAERYWQMYEAILSDGGSRYVDQPVFDNAKPIVDPITQTVVSYEQVGTRRYDLAPEYEWVAFRPELNQELLTLVKKLYWERDHPEETAQAAAVDKAAKAEEKRQTRVAAGMDAVDEAFLETRKVVQFGHGATRSENQ